MPSSPPLTDEEVGTQTSVISAQGHRVRNEGAGVGAQPSGPELTFNTTILSLLCGPLKPFREQGEHSDPIFTKIGQAAGVRVRWKHLEPDLGPSHLHLPASTEPHPLPDPLPKPEIHKFGLSGAWRS